MTDFDESRIFVEPDVYFEKSKEQFAGIEAFYKVFKDEKAVLIVGNDRSGKTVLAKRLQIRMQDDGVPCIFLDGPSLKNIDLLRYIRKARFEQFGNTEFPEGKFSIIVDDFDECNLSDRIKESFVSILCNGFSAVCIVSYSSAPMVLFTSELLPDPAVFKLNALTDDKLFALVQKWNSVSLDANETLDDRAVLATFERLQLIFTQTELDKLPYTAVTFLELIESSTGADIAFSSFAACYDTLITNRLNSIGVNWRSLDESKNFLAILAYKSYTDGGNGTVSHKNFEESLIFFEEQFLSSSISLRRMAIPHFLKLSEGGYSFSEDYLWFFLCARYVVKTLQLTDRKKYVDFIVECTNNIFQKKYANIVIYISYFAEDNFVVESLLTTLDDLFSKADSWVLSDDTREIMLGLVSNDQLQIESKSDVSENRNGLLRSKVTDIVLEAEKVVARYTLPFLSADIEDSSLIEQIDASTIDADSYMKRVNALLRIHSVIGQILSGRAGTYSANFMLDCISRMVKASGRYASLNHAIATILVFNKETSLDEVDRAYSQKGLSKDEKFDKVVRIFTFWSVYLSHAGLARYLSQEHTIRALKRLAETNENVYCQTGEGNTPYNFTAVSIIANLYHTNEVDRDEINRCLRDFGEHSALISILRMAFHMYAYYMPVSYKDKQWLAEKLNMSLQKLEVQNVKSTDSRRLARPSRKLLAKS